LEYGYDKAADQDTYPKRALHAGALFDFELKIRTLDEELDFTCGSSIQGYKVASCDNTRICEYSAICRYKFIIQQ
jgi:hypothetical protein